MAKNRENQVNEFSEFEDVSKSKNKDENTGNKNNKDNEDNKDSGNTADTTSSFRSTSFITHSARISPSLSSLSSVPSSAPSSSSLSSLSSQAFSMPSSSSVSSSSVSSLPLATPALSSANEKKITNNRRIEPLFQGKTLYEKQIAQVIYSALQSVRDPEIGRSVTDLNMITYISVERIFPEKLDCNIGDSKSDVDDSASKNNVENAISPSMIRLMKPGQVPYYVSVRLELTIKGCPLSEYILQAITAVLEKTSFLFPPYRYPLFIISKINVATMTSEKLSGLVEELKAARRHNPFSSAQCRTKIFTVVSGKGGVGKSSIAANLAAVCAARGLSTALIDADIYGFSLPSIFGIHSQPTNLDGMLIPISAWGVKLISIGMFAGTDQAILWRGPRLQRSLQQFLSDVWWADPDVLIVDLPPGTGDMAISAAQFLPSSHMIVVTTPQQSASDVAVRAGLAALRLPGTVCGVIENMSWFSYRGEKLPIFGTGGGKRVSDRLSQSLGYPVPLVAQIPLIEKIREDGEEGRPAVLDKSGHLAKNEIASIFDDIVTRIVETKLENDTNA